MKTTAMQGDLDGPLVDYAAKGTRIELAGMEKVEGRDTYKLKLTMKNGAALHVWIDAETFPEAKIEGQRCADLIQCDFRLGLKRNLFGHFRLFPPLDILGPFLRQI